MTRTDGRTLDGEWDGKNDWSGHGVINYPDGARYVGYWNIYGRHGQGIMLDKERKVTQKGEWEDDKYKGKKEKIISEVYQPVAPDSVYQIAHKSSYRKWSTLLKKNKFEWN